MLSLSFRSGGVEGGASTFLHLFKSRIFSFNSGTQNVLWSWNISFIELFFHGFDPGLLSWKSGFVGSPINGFWSRSGGRVFANNLVTDRFELGISDFSVGKSGGAVASDFNILGHAPTEFSPVNRSSHFVGI